jgi:CPA2 family monovalent cation:H+ antiporter-2
VNHIDLILTITGGLASALLFGFLSHRVGLSPIVGYLLAGVVVGPSTPGFVADESLAAQLAEIGVILLMFGVGLQFHFRELIAVRKVAIPGALVQIATATGLGALVSHAWGYSWSGAVVFGLAISVASTVVLVRVLSDHGDLHTATGRTAVGWLVVEDIFTVLALVALPLWFAPRPDAQGSLGWSLALALLKLVALVLAVVFVGKRAVPRLFEYAANTRSRELFTLTVLVTALGIAVAAAKLFGASMALGAFLAGMIVGQSEFSARAATDALPMRDAFAVLFFVSVGMLFDPNQLLEAPGQIALTLAVILIAKPASAWLFLVAMGKPPRLSGTVALALAQIGEFSFLLASTSQQLGILKPEAASNLVAASILSIAINPLLYRWARKLPQHGKTIEPEASTEPARAGRDERDRAIIVGYGPTGQVLEKILSENGLETCVIDLNLDAVRGLSRRGARAVYGDATSAGVLNSAGLERAAALFLTSAALEGTGDLIRASKELNPDIRIFARATFLKDVRLLTDAGARSVISAEGEVALAMAAELLGALGASPEHIDRERLRFSRELRKWFEPEPPSLNVEVAPRSP